MALAAVPAAALSQGLDYNERVALGLAAAFGTGLGLVTWAFNRETKLSRQAKSHLRRVSLYTLAGIGTTWATSHLAYKYILQTKSGSELLRYTPVAAGALFGPVVVLATTRFLPSDLIRTKRWLYLASCAVIGVGLAPLRFLPVALLRHGTIVTGGVVTVCSAVSLVANSVEYVHMASPLAIGFFSVCVGLLPRTHLSPLLRVGKWWMAGELALFAMAMMWHTSRVVRHAEQGDRGDQVLDYVNDAVEAYSLAAVTFVRLMWRVGRTLYASVRQGARIARATAAPPKKGQK